MMFPLLLPRRVAATLFLVFVSGALFSLPSTAFAQSADAPEGFPALTWVLERASERAPDVVAQRGALRAAEGSMVGARLSQLDNPYLEVFSDRRFSQSRGIAVQGNLWLPLELSGQRGRRIDEVEALSSWQRTGLDVTRARAKGQAVVAYGAVMVAAARFRFLSALVTTAKEEATYYEGRFEQGDATVRDAKLAAVEVARNTVALQEVRADLTRNLAQLAALIGVASLPEPTGPLQGPSEAIWQRVSQTAKELASQSPAVLAATREAEYFEKLKDRQAIEAHAPVNLILSGGKEETGAARIGGGLSWTFPVLRRNQGDQARAQAEQNRALEEREINEIRTYATLRGISTEREQVNEALEGLRTNGEPAAQAALDASIALQRAGKGDLLFILAARRDLALMKASALQLVMREWTLLADFVALTGKTP